MKPLALPLPFERLPDPPTKPRIVRPAEAPSPAKRNSARRGTAWLAIHLSGWPLHAALSTLSVAERNTLESHPLAVVDSDRRSTVIACNQMAVTSGICAGHSINAAIALAATMQFLPRNPLREVELLNEVAAFCERYTSAVSLQPPNEVLLEVRGSLRLFGGITDFVERIREDFKQRGFTPQLAMSSTARSALWLARACETKVVGPRDLVPAIARLPVSVLLWPTEIELRLARFGVACIGDLLRLPRGGLARRIGYERLAELDRAVGRHPEVRQYFQSAERYHDPVLLDFEIETTGLLSVVVEKRLQRLQRFLTRRQLSLDVLRIDLQHRERATTPVTLGLAAAATADMEHVTQLMQEQLSRLQLPAPVIALTIRTPRLLPAPSATRELFSSIGSADAAIATAQSQARLLEQLRSRLGDSAIASLNTHADHRPEYAHRASPAKLDAVPDRGDLPDVLPPRPLWLLPEPRPVGAAALRAGQEERRAGPEKIENGWWDGHQVARDYYRVRSPRGALGWLYRDRTRAGAWHLHGLFG